MKKLLCICLVLFGCSPEGTDTVQEVTFVTGDPVTGDCIESAENCTSDESQEIAEE